MKIIQVVHSFLPYTQAGTEIYSYNLAKALSVRNEVFVFFRVNNPKEEEYSIARTKLETISCYAINHTFNMCNSFKDTYQDDAIDDRFGSLLDELKPDVVHIHHLLFLSHGIVDEAKKRGIPVVFTLHDYWLICYRGQMIKDDLSICDGDSIRACGHCLRYLLRMKRYSLCLYKGLRLMGAIRLIGLLKKPYLMLPYSNPLRNIQERSNSIKEICSKIDKFIAPSRFMEERSFKWGLPKSKLFFSEYGFDDRLFDHRLKSESGVLRFAYMGTLLPMKGIDILINAFKEIKNPGIKLSIYGKVFSYAGFEAYPGHLRKITRNDKRIKFEGGYSNHEVKDILREVDALIVPSLWLENSPLIIQEAFLSWTPVIASNIGGIPELIKDGINGLLFTAGDKKSLQEKINYVINNPGILKIFGQNMPRIKNIRDNAEEIENLYRSLSSGKAGGYQSKKEVTYAE
ncbi:MAG: glycosyltransferase family 4 protein [Candidatus Omnitrophota bacterium]|jgi:glycosyltransferase involved in cell wall biosynthesis